MLLLAERALLEPLAPLVLLFLLALRAVLELPEHAVKLAQLVLLVGDLLELFGLRVQVVLPNWTGGARCAAWD